MLSLQSFLRKGVSLGYVGRNYNLKDLKKNPRTHETRTKGSAQLDQLVSFGSGLSGG